MHITARYCTPVSFGSQITHISYRPADLEIYDQNAVLVCAND